MAITERIGFETADAIANLLALGKAIRNTNAAIRTLNKNANATSLQALATGFQSVATQAKSAQVAVGGASTSMKTAGAVGTKAGNSLTLSWQTFARVIATQAIVRGINAVTQALKDAAVTAFQFQKDTARIAAISNEGAAGLGNLRDRLIEISNATGQEIGEVTRASLEALQNDLGDTATTLTALEGPINRLARVTDSSLTTAVNAVSSVIKAYNLDAAEAARISDILFATYNKGVIELSGLEGRLGTVNNQANALNVSFEEVAGALTALTLSGNNTSFSLTQVRNIFNKMIKPGDDLLAVMKKLGVEGGGELIEKFGGLEGALKALLGEVGGSEKALAALFGTIRGQLGIFGLLNNDAKLFESSLKAVKESAGSLDVAFKIFNEQTAAQFDQELTKLKNSTLGLGTSLGELATDTLTFVNNFIEGFQRLRQRDDFGALEKFARNFGSAFISVIDDIIAASDKLFSFIAVGAARAIALLQKITNPVGAAKNTAIANLTEQMQDLSVQAKDSAAQVSRIFDSQQINTAPLGELADEFLRLRSTQEQAVQAAVRFSLQAKANTARITENTTAVEQFRRSVLAATSGSRLRDLFGQEFGAQARENLRAISDELLAIQNQAAGATGAEAAALENAVARQQERVDLAKQQFGADNEAVVALQNQADATNQIVRNQAGKAENEQRAADAANIANAALQQQKDIADAAGVSMKQLGAEGTAAGKAIENIPDPSVNASAAIAQMNALTQAAIRAAQAVASANSGGGGQGLYHGGRVAHRADGGTTRGADTVPAMLSPGEFVMNRRSSGRFFSQLQAMNAGQAPAFRESGGSVTNVGDINVNVTGGSGSENPDQAARQIASGLRRELRRNTSRIS